MLWVEGRLFDRVGNVLEIVAEGTGTSQEMIVYATMIRLPGSFHVPVTITANPK
jgi:predicted oxidoreductase